MKKIFVIAAIATTSLLFSNRNSNKDSSTASNKTTESSPASSAGSGNISFKLDGKDWKNNAAIATQTGTSILNIASGDDQTEAISIILNHPSTGTFKLGEKANGSYTDPSGANYGSKSGTITITTYTPAVGKTDGQVAGSFSGTFVFDPTKSHVITYGQFSMPVQSLHP